MIASSLPTDKVIDDTLKVITQFQKKGSIGGGSSDKQWKAMPAQTNGPFPNIQSKHSLVASHVTKDKWEKLKGIKTKTSGFTLIQAIACAVEFDNQVGIIKKGLKTSSCESNIHHILVHPLSSSKIFHPLKIFLTKKIFQPLKCDVTK